jgi:pyruvate dehydrogenase E2 component (dihydrolipoamide acetyltransferase)
MGVFAMPSLGADMEAGKLVEWMVKPGDTVKRGDVVAVVETQKGAIEIEIFEEGEVSELTAELGTELPGRCAAGRGAETGRGAARAEGGPGPGTGPAKRA